MNISRESWHYKVIKLASMRHPESLCAYFWKTVWAIMFLVFMAVTVALMAYGASIPLWWWLTDRPMGIAVFIGSVEVTVLLLVWRLIVNERREVEILLGEREKPKPSLFASWLAAKHRKICPLIRFE